MVPEIHLSYAKCTGTPLARSAPDVSYRKANTGQPTFPDLS